MKSRRSAGLAGEHDPADPASAVNPVDPPATVPPPPPRHQRVPHANALDAALAADLERELRASRPVSIAALLAGTALLRIGASGVGIALQFDLTDLNHGRPHGAVIGALGAAQALSEMLFAPILARYADRFGRTRFIVGGPLVGAVAVLLCAIAIVPSQLFGARLIEGISAAAFVPTALGTIAAATSHTTRARAQASGAFEAANLAGYAGGFAIGPVAYQYLGRGAFLILAACYLAAGLVCLRFIPRIPPLPVSPISVILRAVVGKGPIRSFIPAWIGTFALLGAFAANFASLLHHAEVPGQTLVHHFDERLVSAFLVSWIVLLVVGILLWMPLLPRWGSAHTMRRAVPGAWLITGALFALNHLPLTFLPLILPFLLIGIIWLAGFGPAAVAYLAECSETFVADRSALMAFYTVTLAAGGAAGAFLGGVAVSLDYADGLIAFGFVLSLSTFLFLRPVVRYERALLRQLGGDPTADAAGDLAPGENLFDHRGSSRRR